MRSQIGELLEPVVAVVAAVGDGRAALEAVESLDPDLAILDISMPEMDGIEVARELTRRGKRAKVIFVTLNDSQTLRAAAQEAGGLAYLTKTGLRQDLLEIVRVILDSSPTGTP